jgi:uncharacterized protein HemY
MSTDTDRIASFKAMLARGQDNEMLRYTLGGACLDAEQYADAIEHLTQAVTLKPDYTAAWKLLGRAHAAAGDPSAAVIAFDHGLLAGEANGDKQGVKEIEVFRKRALKAIPD